MAAGAGAPRQRLTGERGGIVARVTPSRTRAILEILRDGGDEAVSPQVLRLFGASSLEECLATYDAVGAAERRGLDEAVERVAGHIPTPHVPAAAPAPARAAADDASLAEWEHLYEPPQPAARLMQAYTIHRQLLSLGRSYRVEDPSGKHAFTVSGKVRFARTFSIRDTQGNVLYSVREKLWSVDPMFLIHRDGTEAAVLKRTTTDGRRTSPQSRRDVHEHRDSREGRAGQTGTRVEPEQAADEERHTGQADQHRHAREGSHPLAPGALDATRPLRGQVAVTGSAVAALGAHVRSTPAGRRTFRRRITRWRAVRQCRAARAFGVRYTFSAPVSVAESLPLFTRITLVPAVAPGSTV